MHRGSAKLLALRCSECGPVLTISSVLGVLGMAFTFLLQPVTLALCFALLEGPVCSEYVRGMRLVECWLSVFWGWPSPLFLHAVCLAVCGQDVRHWGARMAQWLERPGLVIGRSQVRIPVGAAGEFSPPGSAFCADSYSGIRYTPVLPQ